MGVITDKQMQAAATAADIWLTEDGPRGAGRFLGRITPRGERAFYFRHTTSDGSRDTLPIGIYDPKGRAGFKLADARAKADQWSKLYQSGIKDLRSHFAQAEADRLQNEEAARKQAELAAKQAELEQQRRLTIRQLFDRWAATELTPNVLANGKRSGRKDGGQYSRDQFERRIFPVLGEVAAVDVRKADLLAILDAVKAEGKLRTCNVLLTDLKQMFHFALAREIVDRNPLDTITKRQAGGAETERERVLTAEEVVALARQLPKANMGLRSVCAVWLTLATGCRVGELMNAQWQHIDLESRTWHLPDTKNQRPHTVHLSDFAVQQIQNLATMRVLTPAGLPCPWVFPNTKGSSSLDIKTFGKQLSDRQRPPEKRLSNRTAATESLSLPGGKWTAHDLRRTAATTMASLGISSDVIDECLNHMIQSRVTRIYIRDRREGEQAKAFDALGQRLAELVALATQREV
jgi:integrase